MEVSTCTTETDHLIEDENEESQETHKANSFLSKVHITIEPAICAMFLSANLSGKHFFVKYQGHQRTSLI